MYGVWVLNKWTLLSTNIVKKLKQVFDLVNPKSTFPEEKQPF